MLARKGKAVVGLATVEFNEFANSLLRQHSGEGLPVVIVGHPVGGIPREQAEALITGEVVENVVNALTRGKIK